MTREPVHSQMLRSIGYDAETQTLELEFEAGTVYRYAGVSEFTFRALMHAKSKGTFLPRASTGNTCARRSETTGLFLFLDRLLLDRLHLFQLHALR